MIASWIVWAFLVSSVESWSTSSFACCPAWVSGFPSFFRESASVFVASLACVTPAFSESFDTPPDFTVDSMLVSDVFQVETAVQTPLAHVSVGVVSLLLEPPHPAAASAASATRSAAPALIPVPAITLIRSPDATARQEARTPRIPRRATRPERRRRGPPTARARCGRSPR